MNNLINKFTKLLKINLNKTMSLIKPPKLHFSLDYTNAVDWFNQFLNNPLLLCYLYLDKYTVFNLSEYIIISYDSCRTFGKYKFSLVVINKRSKEKDILFYTYKDYYVEQLFELYKFTYTGKGKLYGFEGEFKLHFDKGFWNYSYYTEILDKFSNFELGNQILSWLDSNNGVWEVLKLKLKTKDELEKENKIYSEYYEDVPELEVCYGYINGHEFVFTNEKPLYDYKDSSITRTHIVYDELGTVSHKLEANKLASFNGFKKILNKN